MDYPPKEGLKYLINGPVATMDFVLETVYLHQVKQECLACYAAIAAFNLSIKRESTDDPFNHAMTFIHRAASVSRIFWPPKNSFNKASNQRAQKRGKHLSASLGIHDNHSIRSRTLRDHLEHFDERLDEWAEQSVCKNIIHKLLGSKQEVLGLDDNDIILHYDPATKIFAFRGQPFNLTELANGIVDIHQKVDTRLDEIRELQKDWMPTPGNH